MLNLMKTLFAGASARAEEEARDRFAIPLIEQRLREAENGLALAKRTLAALILRERTETAALSTLGGRIADMEARVRRAIEAGAETLARDGAAAIADLENERTTREATVASLAEKLQRMRLSVEKAHRRLADLRQGLIQARAVDTAGKAQRSIDRSLGGGAALREAEDLIGRVLSRDDPFEEAGVLDEIDAGLDHYRTRDRLADAGFGPRTRSTADDVLARLKSAH